VHYPEQCRYARNRHAHCFSFGASKATILSKRESPRKNVRDFQSQLRFVLIRHNA
jgi:hypothetical protein